MFTWGGGGEKGYKLRLEQRWMWWDVVSEVLVGGVVGEMCVYVYYVM